MADKNKVRAKASPWDEIDNTDIDVKGKRVFYQLTDTQLATFNLTNRKCVALVVGANGARGEDGRVVNTLRCWTENGDAFTVKAPLDDSRTPGTYALANDGDKRN
jgi:hypothetical protein